MTGVKEKLQKRITGIDFDRKSLGVQSEEMASRRPVLRHENTASSNDDDMTPLESDGMGLKEAKFVKSNTK